MKQFPAIFIFIIILFASATCAQTNPRKFSISGSGRSASFADKRYTRRQFNLSMIFAYKLSKRTKFNFSIVENFEFKSPGFSFRIY